jgi:hypothetical protein
VIVLAAVALDAFLNAFGGTWTCSSEVAPGVRPSVTHWTIAAVPHSTWTRVTFSPARDGGVAYVGYIGYEKAWTYQAFDDDGRYLAQTSPGPEDGIWTFAGAYRTAEHMIHVAVQWRRDADTIRRTYGRLIGTSFRPIASDVCRR